MNYLYEVRVVDKDMDSTEYNIVGRDIQDALFKINHIVETLDIDFAPYEVVTIKKEKTIDAI